MFRCLCGSSLDCLCDVVCGSVGLRAYMYVSVCLPVCVCVVFEHMCMCVDMYVCMSVRLLCLCG